MVVVKNSIMGAASPFKDKKEPRSTPWLLKVAYFICFCIAIYLGLNLKVWLEDQYLRIGLETNKTSSTLKAAKTHDANLEIEVIYLRNQLEELKKEKESLKLQLEQAKVHTKEISDKMEGLKNEIGN